MVKLDTSILPYLSRDDFRTLTAVEMGMRNHEFVPRNLVYSISGIKNGSITALLRNLTEKHFLTYERSKRYDGYRLTYRGYDFLALNVLRSRGVIVDVESQIGVGKESDVYVAYNAEGRLFAIKFHRLGRTCFRKVSEKRDYQKKNQSHKAASWIYLSRLAAIREFAFMKLLQERQLLPIPEPIDHNRHCIVMELIDGSLLNHIRNEDIEDKQMIETLYDKLMDMIIKLANEFGVVHGDFNEFNILIKNDGTYEPVMIDFPQMISITHELASEYFERDVNCIVDFFIKRFGFESDHIPCFESLEIDDEKNNDIKNLADVLNDDEKLLTHLADADQTPSKTERANDGDVKAPGADQISNRDTVNNPNEKTHIQYAGNDMLSKFLNSLPSNLITGVVDSNEPQYYVQMSDQLIREAQEKVLESKLHGMTLDSEAAVAETETSCDAAANLEDGQEERDTVPPLNDEQFDRQSVHTLAYSTASTFSKAEVKSRLIAEKKKRESRDRMKVNTKNIKGDANALRRRKKNDQALANEDLHAYLSADRI